MYWDGGPGEQKRIQLSTSPPSPYDYRNVQQFLMDWIGIDRRSNYWDEDMCHILERMRNCAWT
jgi:hypothetical protein